MPLILAAIDLKLSSSYEEMITRKKRLDSLSVIVRHSYTLYDVTDYVAVGINHILQLAYLTTKNVFLQCKRPANSTTIETFHSGGDGKDLLRTKCQLNSKRAISWLDAFILWPRAYLLISTSVDYSLAVGRLPYINALPKLVRHIPAMGAVFTLPWAINVNVHPVDRRMQSSSFLTRRRGRSSSSNNQPRVRPGFANSDERRAQHRQSGVRTITSAAQDDLPALDNPETENLMTTQFNGDKGTIINLDYMDLGSAPSSRVSLSPVESNNNARELISSPKDREPGLAQADDHDDDVTAGTTFDLAFFDDLTHELFREDWDDL